MFGTTSPTRRKRYKTISPNKKKRNKLKNKDKLSKYYEPITVKLNRKTIDNL